MQNKFPANSNSITRLMIGDIAKTQVISLDEEIKLFNQYHATVDSGIKDRIRTKIISSNLRFVLKIAIHYNKLMGADLNDLMTEGKLGLYNAFAKYNHTQGIKFISFAVWDIRCMISKYLEENDLVRVPAHVKLKLNKARRELNQGKDPEIDFYTELLMQQNGSPVSLDAHLGYGDDDMTLADVLKDESVPDQETEHYKDYINDELRSSLEYILTNEELTVISAMFGLNNCEFNIKETEQLIGKSRERVRQIRDRALAKLKKHGDIKQLRDLMRISN
jgi:RNA polymerase primary sigma factor